MSEKYSTLGGISYQAWGELAVMEVIASVKGVVTSWASTVTTWSQVVEMTVGVSLPT